MKKPTKKTVALALCVLCLLFLAGYVWKRYVSPTAIAVVNYRDFHYAQFLEAKDNPFIHIDRIDLNDLSSTDISSYSAVFIFGMGVNLDDGHKAAIKKGVDGGAHVHITYHTNADSDLSNITGTDLEYVEGYFDNGGRKNTRALFNYCRRVFDRKLLFSEPLTEPQEIPRDVFYHHGEDTFFTNFDDYQTYYERQGLYKKECPRVCVLTSIVGPRSVDRGYAEDLIRLLEERNINVYPITGFLKRLEFMQAVEPDLVIYIPHGRLAPGQTKKSAAWLKERNIPLLCPVDAFMPYDEWMANQKGLDGGLLSQSIGMTELDGGIEPFTISAQFPNEDGLNVNRSIPDRMERFVCRVENWLHLKSTPNADKKIAIVYFKGHGRNAMTASGLEVAPSLLNVLRHLKQSGYTTGPLPATETEFAALIQKHGPVLGPYAKGVFDSFLENGSPELIPTETYLSWAKEQITPESYADVVREYGDAPGNYLTVTRHDSTYIALPHLRFGNIVLIPQLLPGIGDNESKLVHGARKAPPHPYIAEYLWIKNGFQADAIMHFGTHGSLEFTPWKQTALCSNDWPDALIGDLPHPYIYVINNIGESIIAKRRGYATIISHLTPPFTESDLYGGLSNLNDLLEEYEATGDPALKKEYHRSIIENVTELDLFKDIGISEEDLNTSPDTHMEKLHEYLHTIGQEKITDGLYTIGEPYTEENLRLTARLMATDPVTYSLAKLDAAKGIIPDSLLNDVSFIHDNYHVRANKIIDDIMAGRKTYEDFIRQEDMERLDAWDTMNKSMTEDELFASMLAMADKKMDDDDAAQTAFDPERLKKLIIQISVDPEKKELVSGWKEQKSFEKASSLLDPENMKKAKNVAKLIKPMRETLALIEEPEIHELLTAMQNSEAHNQVFQLLDNPALQEEQERETETIRKKSLEIARSDNYKNTLFSITDIDRFSDALKVMPQAELDSVMIRLRFFDKQVTLAGELKKLDTKDAAAMSAILENSTLLKNAVETAQNHRRKREEEEKNYVSHVRNLKEAFLSVTGYKDSLKQSTEHELASIVNALSGGHIEPSSGGDPVANTESVPTGRNLSAINIEKIPTAEAWKIGVKLAKQTIQQKIDTTGDYPRKVAVSLWGGESIRSRGVPLAMIWYFLGVEPVTNSRGVVHDVALIPGDKLGRPRIDVVVQTSGQFRDIAASRIFLINKAVKLAAEAADPPEIRNNVKDGTLAAEQIMKENGISPLDARVFSTARVFGGVNGNYGTGIMGMVEAGDTWENDDEIAAQYLKNMGAIYTEEHWGHYAPGLFEGALQNTDTVVHNRSSNTWGPLSLDHVYEFMGGISATVRHVTGTDPDAYFSDLRNKHNPVMQDVKRAIWTETRTTLLNPKYIKSLQDGGASSAETFAETFRNTYGWNAMKPEAIDEELWEGLYDVYVQDSYSLDMEDYFRKKNPYALQEMSAVMLETIRKGYWDADQGTRATLASLHAELVKDHQAGCSGFVCDNAKLREFIGSLVPQELRNEYQDALDAVRIGTEHEPVQGMKLERETLTLETVKRVVAENATALMLLVFILVLFSAAVIVGARRRA